MRRSLTMVMGVVAMVSTAALAACSSSSPATTSTDPGADTNTAAGPTSDLVVGISNTVAGNGWREKMICSIKAQALASGQVSKVITVSKNGDPSSQIGDLQNLISQGVNIIVVNPADPEKLNEVIKEATDRGIVVVAVDSSVTEPSAYVVTNDQTKLGAMSAQWLADDLGGKGHILYLRGIQGVQADTDRDTGFQSVMKNYPDITYDEAWSNWDNTMAAQVVTQQFSSTSYDGVWTSGQDYSTVTAIQAAGKDIVPVTGSDNNQFLKDLIDGTPGAAVTNPAVVGGAGMAVALNVINGNAPKDRLVLLDPVLMDAANDMDLLKSLWNADNDPTDSMTVSIEGYTTYTVEQLNACKGPGE